MQKKLKLYALDFGKKSASTALLCSDLCCNYWHYSSYSVCLRCLRQSQIRGGCGSELLLQQHLQSKYNKSEPGVAFSGKPRQTWELKDDLPACSDPLCLDWGERRVMFPEFHAQDRGYGGLGAPRFCGKTGNKTKKASPPRGQWNLRVYHLKQKRDQVLRGIVRRSPQGQWRGRTVSWRDISWRAVWLVFRSQEKRRGDEGATWPRLFVTH